MLSAGAKRVVRNIPKAAATVKGASFNTSPTSSFSHSATNTVDAKQETLDQLKANEKDGPTVVSIKEIPVTTYEKNGVDGQKVEPKKSTLLVNNAAIAAALKKTSTTNNVSKPSFGLKAEILNQLPRTMRKFALTGKVAVVTGGARGLGYNMAQALSEVGVKAIAIMDILASEGAEAVAEIHEATGVPVQYFQVDVRDANAINEAIDKIVDTFGHIDILVNSAGIADSNLKAETYPVDMWRRLIEINLNGAFFCSQAVGRHMIKQGNGGSIILIASMSGGIVNYPQEQACYNASKAGVIQMGKSLAAEWAQYRVRVNCISPGYMDTELNRVPALEAEKKIWCQMTPQHRLGGVDELNNLAVFLASDAASFMTGSNCIIDGGYSVW